MGMETRGMRGEKYNMRKQVERKDLLTSFRFGFEQRTLRVRHIGCPRGGLKLEGATQEVLVELVKVCAGAHIVDSFIV